jgi:hypothetical protein
MTRVLLAGINSQKTRSPLWNQPRTLRYHLSRRLDLYPYLFHLRRLHLWSFRMEIRMLRAMKKEMLRGTLRGKTNRHLRSPRSRAIRMDNKKRKKNKRVKGHFRRTTHKTFCRRPCPLMSATKRNPGRSTPLKEIRSLGLSRQRPSLNFLPSK